MVTFQSTAYALPRTTLIGLSIGITVQALLMTTYCTGAFFVLTQTYSTMTMLNFWFRFYSALSAALFIVDVVLNLSLIALFVRKLRQSVTLRLAMDHSAFSDRLNTRILDLITKQTIIGIPIIFCSGGFLVTESAAYALHINSELVYVIGYCSRAIEGVLVSLLLYLGLSLNANLYRKLCGWCHQKCYHCALSGFKKQVDQGYSMMHLDDVDSNYA